MSILLEEPRVTSSEKKATITEETYPSSSDILSEEFLDKYKNKQPNWGFNGLGYIVYKRTYARTKPDGSTEEWWETIARCVRGAQSIGAKYTAEEAEKLYDYCFNLKAMFSGRAMWQLGTPLVENLRLGDSLLNCWACQVSSIEDFCFIFMESMFGGGVGVNISKEFTFELPRVKRGVKCRQKNTKDADFIIPDSKEGWLDVWRKALEAYLITGKSFTYSPICIRERGEPLKTFGGIAPGPEPLMKGLDFLCQLMENREGKKLRTQDVADIICIGGEIVKSGGIRRTALVLQGDCDDTQFLMLKRWDLGNIPYYRSNSNNSILCPKFEYIPERFWEGYNGNGEPYGLCNLTNARKYGRLGETNIDGFDLAEPHIIGGNPCMEALLENDEPCNLAEIPINNIDSLDEMIEVAVLLYKTQKAIASMNYFHEETNKVVHKNMKLGLSVTGVCQKIDQFEDWCDKTYVHLRKFDKQWSKKNGLPQSKKLTVVQPSGTKSNLSGSMPGGHPGFAKFFIRRVRFGINDPILSVVRQMGVKIEPEKTLDGKERDDVLVAEFPCKFDSGVFVEDIKSVDQLEIVKKLQSKWADQSVSVTIYYSKDQLDSIKSWLKDNYNSSIKTLSFLLHTDHGFVQAPFEKITEDQYLQTREKIKPISQFLGKPDDFIDNLECSGGSCPVR
jgi:ribonucleoside-triphosphate reductase